MHDVIVLEFVADFRAPVAQRGARGANPHVLVRATQHEIGARRADVSTIEQHRDVRFLGVPTALFQAIGNGRKARFMATDAVIDTIPYAGIDEIHRGSGHGCPPSLPERLAARRLGNDLDQ
jgi:hypothetical protein